ncbi:hypothetical protein FRB97_004911 [Tulasnella sp. 331]|nr:hypothetical protein FRB97_004911 [Tulasnella sp. 331]
MSLAESFSPTSKSSISVDDEENQNSDWTLEEGAAKRFTFFEPGTAPPADAMISQCGLLTPPSTPTPLIILDNACGTGIVTRLLCEKPALEGRPFTVFFGDVSPDMIGYCKAMVKAKGWKGVKGWAIDAQGFRSQSLHLKVGLPQQLACCGIKISQNSSIICVESARILKPGGTVGFTTWNHQEWFDSLRLAVSRVPGAPPMPEITALWRKTGMWDDPPWVEQQLVELGFSDLKVQLLDYKVNMGSPKEFVAGASPMISQLTRGWASGKASLLPVELEKALEEKYGGDGPFEQRMVAIIASAKKPEFEH